MPERNTKKSGVIVVFVLICAVVGFAGIVSLVLNPNHERNCNDLKEKAFVAIQDGRKADAERFYKEALSEAEESKVELLHSSVLIDLAKLYEADGRFADAESCLTRALPVYRKRINTKSDTIDAESRELLLGFEISVLQYQRIGN